MSLNMLMGQYRNTLDEKGRIMYPSKLRSVLADNDVVVTQGLDKCLMIFTPDYWMQLNEKIMGSVSLFNNQNLSVMRRFLGPAQSVEFDKSGRLSIPQGLRDYAGLKGECVIIGLNKYMELWDAEAYQQYLEQTEASFDEAKMSMSSILL